MNQVVLTNLESLKEKINDIEKKISNLDKNVGVNLEEEVKELNSYIENKIAAIGDKIKNIDSSFSFTEEKSNSNFLVEYSGNWLKDFQERLKDAEDNEISSLARELRNFELSMYTKGYYLKEYEDIIKKVHSTINSKLILVKMVRDNKSEIENPKIVKQPLVTGNNYPTPQVTNSRRK